MSIFENYNLKNLIQSKRRIFPSAIYYFILQLYSAHSLDFTGLKLEIKFNLSALSFNLSKVEPEPDLYTGSGCDQKVPAPTGSGSATLQIRRTSAEVLNNLPFSLTLCFHCALNFNLKKVVKCLLFKTPDTFWALLLANS